MKLTSSIGLAGMLLCAGLYLGTTGCHYDGHTAGRPSAEENATPGSTAASKEGTGDPAVGSGAGQVGTDAPEKKKSEAEKK